MNGFDSVIREFARCLPVNAVATIFYFGHGVQYQNENYLVPIGAMAGIRYDRDIPLYAYPLKQLLGHLEQSASQLNIVFLDACRNNPFLRSRGILARGLARQELSTSPKDILIYYATLPGQVASDGRGRNSPYTLALLDNIEIPNVDVESMMRRIKRHIIHQQCGRKPPGQCGEMQIPWGEGSIQQQFCFAGCSTTVVDVTAQIRTTRFYGTVDWDNKIRTLLTDHYDIDGSGYIDSDRELDKVNCDVVEALQYKIRQQSPQHEFITSYGFSPRLSFAGHYIGFDENIRARALDKFTTCLNN